MAASAGVLSGLRVSSFDSADMRPQNAEGAEKGRGETQRNPNSFAAIVSSGFEC
jgi:hypothetical protein